MLNLNLVKSLIIWFVLCLSLILNIFVFNSLIIGIIFGTAYLIFFGTLLGKTLFPYDREWWQLSLGLLIFLALISSIGSVVYYLLHLNNIVICLLITILPLIIVLLPKKETDIKETQEQNKFSFNALILTLCYLLLAYTAFYILFENQTVEAIRSPWWIVPKDFFIVYFLASFSLMATLYYNKKIWLSLILSGLHTFLTLSVALIVYKLGYGFDPFLHQATEKVIATAGAVTPKTLYYLGQYSLVVFLAKIFQISVIYIDKFLLIATASIYLPLTIYYTFSRILKSPKRDFAVATLFILLLPLSSFIVTTPQGLANLFTLLTVLFGLIMLVTNNKIYLIPTIILAVTTLLIHPLSGIPIMIFIFIAMIVSLVGKSRGWIKFFEKTFLIEIVVLASIALPLIFILFSSQGGNLASMINTELIDNPTAIINNFNFDFFYLKNHFNLIFDLVYIYSFDIYWIIFFISIIGIIAFWLKFKKKSVLVLPLTFFIILINFWLLKNFISFPSLIEYERINYPQRLLEISYYFLLPFFLYSFYIIISKSRTGPKTLRFVLFIITSLFLSTSVYLAYPRDDDYHLDRGYNLTQADINSVRYINQDGDGSEYIVLANQITSVAAIKEFSFKKYYSAQDNTGKLYFYYPIPTGDPMYQYYLDMVYDRPKKETAYAAMDLVKVNKAYFVINNYWWKFEQIVEQAKEEADDWINIDNGKIYIFKYLRQ